MCYNYSMNKKSGLTIIEALLVILAISLITVIFFIQKSDLDALHRDDIKKSAINAIYYALEESFYKDHGYYPEYLTKDTLTVIDPANFTDPSGYTLGDPESSYSYQAANCVDGKCQEYTLKASLEKEATYAKYNSN